MRIVLCYPVAPRHLEQIQIAAPSAEIVNAGQEGVDAALPDADIFCGHAKVPVNWQSVVDAGRLKWIQSSAAGMDHCLTPPVIASDILVSSSSGLFADQVAEQTMALLLGLVRSMPVFYRAQQRREFIRRPTRDLHGMTVGIVGFGGNGKRLAEVLAPFGVHIVATDLFPTKPPPYVEAVWTADALPRLLRESDVVILCAPLNSHTTGMIAREQFAMMKPESLLINVGRGPLIVESDLVDALREKKLSGAGLDVTEIEPLPDDSPLWDMENVVITPHVGAQSAQRVDTSTTFFCENLVRYQQGEPLKNLVDKELGFPIRVAPS